jgi:DNA-binding NarL/FixJ family response regulator
MPQIGAVSVASNARSALTADLDPTPALVLLDSGMTVDDVWLTLRGAKARWPLARTIVLVSDVQQQAEAEAAGADMVLLEGFPAGRLVAAILRLLPQPAM